MKLVLLGCDDWQALYIDGVQHEENHSLNLDFILEAVTKKFAESGDAGLTYEHAYFEPPAINDREPDYEEPEPYYPEKLEDVDPILREGISL